MSKLETKDWFVLYTKSRHERHVHEWLSKKNIDSFLPLIKEVRQWKDRKKKVETPLFPNYLFVRPSANDVNSILTVNGVIRYVSLNGKLEVLADQAIDNLKKMINVGEPTISFEEFKTGTHASITHGPLKGLTGVVVVHKGRHKLAMKIDALNRFVLVDILKSHLTKDASSRSLLSLA